MICIYCDAEDFVTQPEVIIEQSYKGETLHVKTPANVCVKCGHATLTLDQADELRSRTADAYRDKHGLLTSAQIKAWRKILGMSQREFAHFLSVGEASVKRWETWLVQERANDQLIRLKCQNAVLSPMGKSASAKFSLQATQTITVANHLIIPTQSVCVQSPLANWNKKVPVPEIKTRFVYRETIDCAANNELALAA